MPTHTHGPRGGGVSYELILGDCLEVMRGMADKSVSCVVTDPPYGIGVPGRIGSSNKGQVTDYGDTRWDKHRVSGFHITELRRVSIEQVIFGGNFYADQLPASASWIVWDKVNSADFADCELAWTSHKKAVRQYTYMWNGMIKQMPEERYHPTQKPLSLMIWVMENYTKPGDTVLDPFAGSFTTGVACLKTGRNFIGIEKDPAYFEIGKKRMEMAAAQPMLFEVNQ